MPSMEVAFNPKVGSKIYIIHILLSLMDARWTWETPRVTCSFTKGGKPWPHTNEWPTCWTKDASAPLGTSMQNARAGLREALLTTLLNLQRGLWKRSCRSSTRLVSNGRSTGKPRCSANLGREPPVCAITCVNMHVRYSVEHATTPRAPLRKLLMIFVMNKHPYVKRYSNPGSTNLKQTKLTWTGTSVSMHVEYSSWRVKQTLTWSNENCICYMQRRVIQTHETWWLPYRNVGRVSSYWNWPRSSSVPCVRSVEGLVPNMCLP